MSYRRSGRGRTQRECRTEPGLGLGLGEYGRYPFQAMHDTNALHLPSKRVLLTTIAGFFLLTFAVYGASLRNGFALLDDGLLIFENNAIREISLETLKAIFTSYDPELYIPLTFLSYQVDYLVGGYNPVMYHLTNLLLHTFNVLLVTWIVFLLARLQWVAVFVGTFFAVHPLNVETIVWAAARKDLLSTFFFLASLLAYLRYHYRANKLASKPANESTITSGRGFYVASLALFLLGLLSKVTALTLPLVLLLCEWCLRRGKVSGTLSKRFLTPFLPFFALSLLFAFIALGGKRELVTSLTFAETFLLSCKSIALSLWHILFPLHLSLLYPQLTPVTIASFEFLIPIVIALLLLLPALFGISPTPIVGLRERRNFQYVNILKVRTLTALGSGKAKQQWAFGILFFLITLAPNLLTFAKGGENIFVTSDRYSYLPSIGILFALGTLLMHFLEAPTRMQVVKQRRVSVLLGTSIVALTFAVLTIRQSLLWGRNVALFEHVARLSPDFYLSHIHLGVSYRLAGKLDKAAEAFKEALRLRPLGNTHGAVAQVYAQQNKLPEAIAEFELGIVLDPSDYELHHGLGQVYALQGRFDEALAEFEKALELMPQAPNPYLKLARRAGARRDIVLERIGILYGEKGEHERAIEYYRKALEENPFFADAHYNLAVALGNLREEKDAISHYERAIELEPKHIKARVNLALLLGKRGNKLRAITLLREALAEDPLNAIAKEALRKL